MRCWLLSIVVVLGACSVLEPLSSPPLDAGAHDNLQGDVVRDAGQLDAAAPDGPGTDAPKTDAPWPDDIAVSPDRNLIPLPDGAGDTNPGDLVPSIDLKPWPDQQPVDGPVVVDLKPWPDQQPVDGPPAVDLTPWPDQQPVDGPVPVDVAAPIQDTGGPVPPCADGKSPVFTYQADMVICANKTKHDQCTAEQICNQAGGWHLCSANEFIGRGGGTTPVTGNNRDAWLASCLRDNGKASKPTNNVCSSCASTPAVAIGMACDCVLCNPVYGADTANVGVTPWDVCMYLAFTVNKSAAYWAYASADALFDRAVCCN